MRKIKDSFISRRLLSASKGVVDVVLPRQPLFRRGRYDHDAQDRGAQDRGAQDRTGGAGQDGQSWADVAFIDEPCCERCGFPFAFDEGPKALCGRCAAKPLKLNQIRAAFAYDAASRGLVLRFKHGGETEGLPMFAGQLQRAGRHMLGEADLLVPVPLHAGRLIKRRYNQSALLAGALSLRCGVAVNTNGLLRRRKTESQGGKSGAGRRRNVQGAFAVSRKVDFSGLHIVLIDDVMTTGATLEACARCLQKAGAKKVDGLVLSRVVKPAVIPT